MFSYNTMSNHLKARLLTDLQVIISTMRVLTVTYMVFNIWLSVYVRCSYLS